MGPPTGPADDCERRSFQPLLAEFRGAGQAQSFPNYGWWRLSGAGRRVPGFGGINCPGTSQSIGEQRFLRGPDSVSAAFIPPTRLKRALSRQKGENTTKLRSPGFRPLRFRLSVLTPLYHVGQSTVPIFVPTHRMERLLAVASAPLPNAQKPLRTRNIAQSRVTVVPGAKFMKRRWFLATNQKVACSSHAGRTIPFNPLTKIKRGLKPPLSP